MPRYALIDLTALPSDHNEILEYPDLDTAIQDVVANNRAVWQATMGCDPQYGVDFDLQLVPDED